MKKLIATALLAIASSASAQGAPVSAWLGTWKQDENPGFGSAGITFAEFDGELLISGKLNFRVDGNSWKERSFGRCGTNFFPKMAGNLSTQPKVLKWIISSSA